MNEIKNLKFFNKEKIKEFFERNKIFFETIVVTLLSAMAIIVSVNSNSIQKNQESIMNIEILPKFYVENIIETEINTEKGLFDRYTDKINIYNQEDVFRNFESNIVVFYEVSLSKDSKVKIELIPINNYFMFWYPTGYSSDSDLVYTIYTMSGNFNIAFELGSDFSDFVKKEGGTGLLQLRKFLKISYQDILNNNHVEYYNIPYASSHYPVGATLMNQSDGEKLFKKYEEGKIFQFSELTPQKIFDIVNKIEPSTIGS